MQDQYATVRHPFLITRHERQDQKQLGDSRERHDAAPESINPIEVLEHPSGMRDIHKLVQRLHEITQ
jgi:hypothetical protein